MNEQFNYPKDSDKEIPNLKYQTGSPGFEPGLSDPESEGMVRYPTSPLSNILQIIDSIE